MFLKANGQMTKHSYWAPSCLFNHLGFSGHLLISDQSRFLPRLKTDIPPSDAEIFLRIRIVLALRPNIWVGVLFTEILTLKDESL